jgi:hypothetical protein
MDKLLQLLWRGAWEAGADNVPLEPTLRQLHKITPEADDFPDWGGLSAQLACGAVELAVEALNAGDASTFRSLTVVEEIFWHAFCVRRFYLLDLGSGALEESAIREFREDRFATADLLVNEILWSKIAKADRLSEELVRAVHIESEGGRIHGASLTASA